MFLGLVALPFTIVCCVERSYDYYYYYSNAYLNVSTCWACGVLVILEVLGLHIAKQSKDRQWQLLGLVLDCLALACGITSLVVSTER